MKNNKIITVDSTVDVKKSPDFKDVTYKATAGLDKAEAIERYTIGEYNRQDDESEEKQEEG